MTKEGFHVGIDAGDYELPGEPLDIAAMSRHAHLQKRVEAIIASGCRYYHAANVSEVELATRAVGKLVDAKRFAASDIGAIIHVHTQPFSTPPAPRSLPLEVASAFGIRPLWAGSVAQLHCASIAAGFKMLQGLMSVYPQLDAGLIVSSDRVYADHYRLRPAGILCDGAACLLATRNSTRNRIGSIAIYNHAKWYPSSDGAADVKKEMIAYDWIHTRRILDAVVKASGLTLGDYARVIPQNDELPGWRSLCRGMRIPEEKLFTDNIFRTSHACCSDFGINLVDAGFASVDGGAHAVALMRSNSGAFAGLTLHPVN